MHSDCSAVARRILAVRFRKHIDSHLCSSADFRKWTCKRRTDWQTYSARTEARLQLLPAPARLRRYTKWNALRIERTATQPSASAWCDSLIRLVDSKEGRLGRGERYRCRQTDEATWPHIVSQTTSSAGSPPPPSVFAVDLRCFLWIDSPCMMSPTYDRPEYRNSRHSAHYPEKTASRSDTRTTGRNAPASPGLLDSSAVWRPEWQRGLTLISDAPTGG